MKKVFFLSSVLAIMAVSCVSEPQESINYGSAEPVFHAMIEAPGEPDTKVYVDDQLRVLWNANDQVSIFNKTTYNRQYRFTGQDGDNAGSFAKVSSDDFVTSNPLDNVYAVYPYKEDTRISNDGELTVNLPAVQPYRENSFGNGANTMVAVTQDDELMFKNLCGYLAVRLYGDEVSVSSITLRGNNEEPLAGNATITAGIGALPALQFGESGTTKEISISFETAKVLGSTAEDATTFWFVVPPTTFEKGFTIMVTDSEGGTFSKSTTGSLEISRNVLKKTAALKVTPEKPQPKNVIYYTSTDGEIVTPSKDNVFGANIISNEIVNGRGIITFDGDVTCIGSSAFYNKSNLETISIPGGVEFISASAFYRCSGLVSVILHEGVMSIGMQAFYGCSSLTSFVIPESVTSISEGAFVNCTSLLSFRGKFATSDGLLLIDSGTILAAAIGGIGASLVIPNNVTSIGQYAFSGCTNLNSVVFPSGMISIENYSFSGCSNLSSFSIPESVTRIGDMAFQSCTSLTTISIPSGVTSLEQYTFNCCSGLTSIVLPESLIKIGNSAFRSCVNLNEIILPGSLTSIDVQAFSGCTSLTNITIPESVTSIGESVFEGCTSMLSFKGKYASSDGLLLIDAGKLLAVAVGGVGAEVVLPDGLTEICSSVFRDCTNICSIIIPDSVTRIGSSAFYGCTNLSSVVIPAGVTTIARWLFANCTSLSSVVIPKGVTSVGYYAFTGCRSLTSFDIPASVTSIGNYAFSGCSNLTSINVFSITPPIKGRDMFKSTNEAPIYVPITSFDSYISYWSEYSDRIKPMPVNTEAVDLGLSVKWASCNVGAYDESQVGMRLAWGELAEKDHYDWDNYKWCNGTSSTLTKYCTNSSYGTVDGKTHLEPEDDVATVLMGEGWRMPTKAEMDALVQNCTWTKTSSNGVDGYRVTGTNGNSIFIPLSGQYDESGIQWAGDAFLWTSDCNGSYYGYSCQNNYVGLQNHRHDGLPVRGVMATVAE